MTPVTDHNAWLARISEIPASLSATDKMFQHTLAAIEKYLFDIGSLDAARVVRAAATDLLARQEITP